MITEQYEYTFPGYALCALLYGDYSGLDDDEESALNAFLEREHYIDCWDVKRDTETGEPCEPYFSSNPEFGLPSNCIDVIGTIFKKGGTEQ